MMINEQTLEELFCSTLQTIIFGAPVGDPDTDVLVVRGEQGKPRPNTDTYIDIRLADFRQVGQEQVGRPTTALGNLAPIDADYRIEIRVRAIGKRAKDNVALAQFAFNRTDVIDAFNAGGLSFALTTDIVHVPILLDTAFEPRSQFIAVFHATQRQLVDLGYILSIESVDMEYEGAVNSPYTISSGPIEVTTV